MKPGRTLTVLLLIVPFATVPCSTRQSDVSMRRNTVVPVRLMQFISSETSIAGDLVRFRVARDIIVEGAVVIKRGSPATGTIVEAAPYRQPTAWSGSRPGRLAFSIDSTTAVDGQTIRLGAPPVQRGVSVGGAILGRATLIEWVHEAVAFDARVDGEYVVRGRPPRAARSN